MLQQMEVSELIPDLNQKQAEKSLNYACGALIMALLIMMFGLTMLYSTSFATAGGKFFYTQLFWAFIGVSAMIAVVFVGYRRLGNWSIFLMFATMALLVIAAFFSKSINGANRWIIINIGRPVSFQPSEMAKPVLALYAAKVASEHLRQIAHVKQWKCFLIPCAMIGCVILLVMAGKDLGTTLLLAATMGVLVIVAGVPRWCWLVPLVAAVVIFFAIEAFSPERMSRITSFMDTESVRDDDGYQLWNSLLALGSGNWNGIGFMESRMKQRYLPEAHTDFILSIVGEELGYVGMCSVLLAYALFGWFGMKIALNSRSRYGMLLASSLTACILMQACINVGVVSGGLPTKGIPAPLISYGGSNLLMSLVMVGLIISVGLENVPGLTDNWLGRGTRQSCENS